MLDIQDIQGTTIVHVKLGALKNNAAQTLELTKAEFSSWCLLDAAGQSALIVSRNHAIGADPIRPILGSSNQRSGLPKVIVHCRMANKGSFHPR